MDRKCVLGIIRAIFVTFFLGFLDKFSVSSVHVLQMI